MIVLPAIPAIVAALTPIVEAIAVSSIVGGAFAAGTGAVGCGVSGYREHGEVNGQVIENSTHCAAKSGTEGALAGAAMGGVGVVLAPLAAPAVQVADDLASAALQAVDEFARPVVGAVDDAARPVLQVVDDAVRPALNAVDDAVGPAVNKAGRAAGSFGHAIASPLNRALNYFRARIYKRLPVTKVGADDGWVYLIEDATTGVRKIGHTSNPAQRLKSIQSRIGHKNVRYSCIIHSSDKKGLEKLLQSQYASHKTTHPISHSGMTEWFFLSAAQVASACSH